MQELVKCKVCGKEMKWIQNRHLALHGMTREDYKAKYPGSPLKSESMTKKLSDTRGNKAEPNTRVCAREGCTNITRKKHNKYCSNSCRSLVVSNTSANPFKSKETNPNYKNGSGAHQKSQKKKAFKRDNKTCQRCSKDLQGIKYEVHHIIPRKTFIDLTVADDLNNLISLCNPCHSEVEFATVEWLLELYRNKDFKTDEELIEFLRNKIKEE